MFGSKGMMKVTARCRSVPSCIVDIVKSWGREGWTRSLGRNDCARGEIFRKAITWQTE